MSEATDRLAQRIDALDADIIRITQEADRQILELRGQKAQLTKMKLALVANPELETLMAQAKALGVL